MKEKKFKSNKNKAIILMIFILAALIAVLAAAGIYSGIMKNENDSSGKLFRDGCSSICRGLKSYKATGSEDLLTPVKADMEQMEMLAPAVKEVNKSAMRIENFSSFTVSFIINSSKYKNDLDRIITAFALLAEEPDDDYPYIQLKIAKDNAG